MGYDLVRGNPATDRYDPGFRAAIFYFSYNTSSLTSDNKYIIPDNTIDRKRDSCSYSSHSEEYTGVNKYQKSLQTLVDVSGAYDSLLTGASFSASAEYKSMERATTQDKSIIEESKASCEIYSIEMPTSSAIPLSEDFKNYVTSAYKNETKWKEVINMFGTHYISFAVMGGRMHLQLKLTSKDYQQLISSGVDVKAAAKFKFALFTGSVSDEVKYDEKKMKQFENKISDTREIYIGGKPTEQGNWKKWYEQLIENLAPVSYKVIDISSLFTTKNFPNMSFAELIKMKKIFNEEVKNHCKDFGCKPPSEDQSLPQKFRVKNYRTDLYGRDRGNYFEDDFPTEPNYMIKEVKVRYGDMIDALQFKLSDGTTSSWTKRRGGLGGDDETWVVPEGEYITQIEITFDRVLYSITFLTNKGNHSKEYGSTGRGTYKLIKLNGYLVGIYGKQTNIIKQIGFLSQKLIE